MGYWSTQTGHTPPALQPYNFLKFAMRSLYIHVPFCPTICPYCDFHVVRRHGSMVDAYLMRLSQEARQLHQHFSGPLQTLYFGGGTPSFLRNHELEGLFQALPWSLPPDAEVTMEVNPGTLDPERVNLIKGLGVNRVSIGVQSFQDPVLKSLGRAHGRSGALEAIELCQKAGLGVSVDVILGLPGQDIQADLREVVGLGLEHVSAYTLQIEPGTPYAAHGLEPDPDSQAEAFELAEEILGAAGLQRYEVSNFAKLGQQSQHNLAYWRSEFWGALGPAGAGHLPFLARLEQSPNTLSVRYTNPPLPRWLTGETPTITENSPLEHVREALMMGLRIREGINVDALEQRSRLELWTPLQPALDRLVAREWVKVEPPRIVSTSTGLPLLHRTILELWEALEGCGKEPITAGL
jgi:oxygen-independent coproporphyrinogen-3 oxidase